jgi:hypothetical protein
VSEPAPRPWDWIFVATGSGSDFGHVYIVDANNRKIAAVWGKAGEKQKTADLIIEAVNSADQIIQSASKEQP